MSGASRWTPSPGSKISTTSSTSTATRSRTSGRPGGSYPEDPDIAYLKEVRSVIAWRNEHAPGKQVWLTEFGYDSSTHPPAKDGPWKDWQGVTDEQQAQYIVRCFLVLSALDLDRANLYFFNDKDEAQLHGASGITRNFKPKPSYYAMSQLYRDLAITALPCPRPNRRRSLLLRIRKSRQARSTRRTSPGLPLPPAQIERVVFPFPRKSSPNSPAPSGWPPPPVIRLPQHGKSSAPPSKWRSALPLSISSRSRDQRSRDLQEPPEEEHRRQIRQQIDPQPSPIPMRDRGEEDRVLVVRAVIREFQARQRIRGALLTSVGAGG